MATDLEEPRTRGYRKKERTRRQLIDAGERVLDAKGTRFAASDVTAEAGLSNGTFYNYFSDTDELVDAITRRQLLEIGAEAAEPPYLDPALQVAVMQTEILARAESDRRWAGLALRLVHRVSEPNHLNGHLRDVLIEGRARGRFTCETDDATLDLATGLTVMTIRRIVADTDAPDLTLNAVTRLLIALGLDEDEARGIAIEAGAS